MGTAPELPKIAGRLIALACGLLLTACGVAGGDGVRYDRLVPGGTQADLGMQIATPPLPPARLGTALDPVQLEVVEPATVPLRWDLWEGALPQGIELESGGRLVGTPETRGVHVFSVRVTDGRRAGLATLALAVDDFGLFPCAGLTAGDAWAGRPVVLATAGAEGRVVFDTLHSDSGGSWQETDADGSRAVWIPGGSSGELGVDQLRARDLATGREALLSLVVRPDPTAGFVAAFGASDVWHVNWSAKRGAHPYASDFHAALVQIGLRSPESTGRIGTPADELAALWMRVEVLQQLNRFFQRETNGEAGATGLPITFPFHEPGPGYGKPPAGAASYGGPTRFSEISVMNGSTTTILGTALADDVTNRLHENDTTAGDGDLGVFVNTLAGYFNSAYATAALRGRPVSASDLSALRALLHGARPVGARYTTLRTLGRRFALLLAAILAHEIGHSLGLPHDAGDENSIMAPHAPITPWAEPGFTDADLADLRARLPGPGRYGTTDLEHALTASDGAHVCAGRACHLKLPRRRTKPLPHVR